MAIINSLQFLVCVCVFGSPSVSCVCAKDFNTGGMSTGDIPPYTPEKKKKVSFLSEKSTRPKRRPRGAWLSLPFDSSNDRPSRNVERQKTFRDADRQEMYGKNKELITLADN